LVQEGQSQGEDDQCDEDELTAQGSVADVEHHAEARLAAQHVIVGFSHSIKWE
jgi:hypothetical protein